MDIIEMEARSIFGRMPRMPRKRKKVVKKAIKACIKAEINNGNWWLIGSFYFHAWPKKREAETYGRVNWITN